MWSCTRSRGSVGPGEKVSSTDRPRLVAQPGDDRALTRLRGRASCAPTRRDLGVDRPGTRLGRTRVLGPDQSHPQRNDHRDQHEDQQQRGPGSHYRIVGRGAAGEAVAGQAVAGQGVAGQGVSGGHHVVFADPFDTRPGAASIQYCALAVVTITATMS